MLNKTRADKTIRTGFFKGFKKFIRINNSSIFTVFIRALAFMKRLWLIMTLRSSGKEAHVGR